MASSASASATTYGTTDEVAPFDWYSSKMWPINQAGTIGETK